MSEIKYITEPKVRLVGRLTIDDGGLAGFLEDEGVETWETDTEVAGQKLVEVAGRLCYKSYARPRPGGNAAYLDHILEVGHGSVLEHAVFNFVITGVSRSFSHELVRHRAGWAYSQRSQRFVDEAEGSFVVPPALKEEVALALRLVDRMAPQTRTAREACEHFGSHKWAEREYINGVSKPTGEEQAGLRWLVAMEHAQEAYGDLAFYLRTRSPHPYGSDEATLARKKAREAARSVLPNATETQIFVTANARALRHFIEMRASKAADAEIRRVALLFLDLMRVESPNLFGDYLDGVDADGGRYASTPHAKV